VSFYVTNFQEWIPIGHDLQGQEDPNHRSQERRGPETGWQSPRNQSQQGTLHF